MHRKKTSPQSMGQNISAVKKQNITVIKVTRANLFYNNRYCHWCSGFQYIAVENKVSIIEGYLDCLQFLVLILHRA